MSTNDWRERDDFLEPGERSDLDSCDREAIHLIPAIQGDGSAIVCDDGMVVAASRDLAEFVGRSVDAATTADIDDLVATGRDIDGALGGVELRLRAHRSLNGPIVVEGCQVEDLHVDVGREVGRLLGEVQRAGHLTELLHAAAEAARRELGYDRVWVYRFDEEYRGEIVAEAVDSHRESFLGLRFGEGDIPAQARALYLENRVRIVRDTTVEAVPIEPAPLPSGQWLDTSGLTLRAVSPIHLTYLRNMGVTASASISIIVDGRLWGLISAHHYSGPRLLGPSQEQLAGIIGDLVSMQVSAMAEKEAEEFLASRRSHLDAVLSAVTTADSIIDGLVERVDDLVALAGATGCAVRVGGEIRSVGEVPSDRALDELFAHLDDRRAASGDDVVVYESIESIGEHAPSMIAHRDIGSGLLALLISRTVHNWLVWFRPERIATVTYGDRTALHDDELLTPQGSFAKYQADVEGCSEPWRAVTSVALALRSELGAAVFQQSERLARRSSALRAANAELDRFAYIAAHDLKEPLRGIHNYADLIEEDFGSLLGDDGIVYISAVRRLSERMSSLLESLLAYATADGSQRAIEPLRLSSLVDEATEFVRGSLDDSGGSIELLADTEIQGDRHQLVQVITNLLSNAIKYTDPDDRPHIEIDLVGIRDTERGWSAWPHQHLDAPSPTVIAVRDSGIGVPEHMREEIFEVFRRLHRRDEYGGGSGAGLTIARRIAERHDGTVWVEPNTPVGSVFYLAIPTLAELPSAP